MPRIWAVALCLSLFTACKPGPGSSCDKGEARCVDKHSQLVCQNGSYILDP